MNQKISLPQLLQFSLAILLILTLVVLITRQTTLPAALPHLSIKTSGPQAFISQAPEKLAGTENTAERWQEMGEFYYSRSQEISVATLRWQKMGTAYKDQEFAGLFEPYEKIKTSSLRWQATGEIYTAQVTSGKFNAVQAAEISSLRWQAMGEVYAN